ncbi:MAG: hypothetical protein AAGA03_20285, partial [Planctomycetota bacterium]
MPRITVSGTVLQSSIKVLGTEDTVLLDRFWRHSDASSKDKSIALSVQADQRVHLLRRDITTAIGWLTAVAVFSLAWIAAVRKLLWCVPWLSFVLLAAVLFPFWSIPLITWCAVPTILSVLTVSAVRWRNAASDTEERWDTASLDSGPGKTGDSFEFSHGGVSALLCALMTLGMIGEGVAQTTDESIQVLVPVDPDGVRVGSVVYVPNRSYESWTRLGQAQNTAEPNYVESDYVLRLQDPRNPSQPATLMAEYTVALDKPAPRLHLSIPHRSVQQVEHIEVDEDRPLRFERARDDSLIIVSPALARFRLRLTILPDVREAGGQIRLEQRIPPVANAKLTVLGPATTQQLEVNESLGGVTRDAVGGRWEAFLGAIDSLRVRHRSGDAQANSLNQPLRIRHWLQVGRQTTVIHSELETPTEFRAGELLPVQCVAPTIPVIASKAWQVQSSEMIGTNRSRLSLLCTVDQPGPVELLLSLPTFESSRPSDDSLDAGDDLDASE